jgi:hypothetical protein
MPLQRVLRAKLAAALDAGAAAADEPGPRPGEETDGHVCCGCGHGAHHHHDQVHDHGEEGTCGGGGPGPVVAAGEDGGRLVAAFRSAMKDLVDVGVYFTVGVAFTALFNTGIAPGASWLDQVASQPVGAPAALMVLAYVLSLCSTSDAFIAATLDRFTYGAKLAFLVFGPMMDVKLTFLYQTVLLRRFILGLALGIFVAIGGAAVFWQHLLLNSRGGP